MTRKAPHNMDSKKTELVLAQLEAIPPLDAIATRILTLTEDSTSHSRQIVELIGADPALTARLLTLLSRAEHGLRSEVINIGNAVQMLGFERIRQVTLALKVMEAFDGNEARDENSAFDPIEFWKHCLATACAARSLAIVLRESSPDAKDQASSQRASRPFQGRGTFSFDPEEAFICGLLHDIGKIAVETAMPKSFDRIVRKANKTRADIADVERELLGMDHTVIGHRLAERWGLPSKLTECIWLHHHAPEALPPSVASEGHIQIVQLADTIAREQHIGYSGNHRLPASSKQLAELLGISQQDLQRIVESLGDEIDKRVSWIGIDKLDYREVYLRALLQSTEDLSAANTALTDQNRRLQRQSEYFAVIHDLNEAVTTRASVREVCAAGAAALRRAICVDGVIIFVAGEDDQWMEIGLCDGRTKCAIEPRASEIAEESLAAATAIELARSGTWVSPFPAAFRALSDRYLATLGEGTLWLIPIVQEQHWVGGALFVMPLQQAAGLGAEANEIGALSAAIGLAISQTQTRTAAQVLGDELAEVNRRLVAMQGELLHAKTLETVVAMAAGAAHELNNPLSVITGRAQLLRDRITDGDVRETLDTIANQAKACSDIVTELMNFACCESPEPSAINLESCLQQVKSEFELNGLLEAGSLSIEIPSDTPPAWFDPRHLTLLFQELLRNSVEATEPSSRRLTVKAALDLTEDSITVIVSDNGRGMTPDVLGRAADPFFSHRPAGRGRGLGLARVQQWLQLGGGTMRMESDPGEGTTVELQLPTASD